MAWTSISASREDTDSPVDEDLVGDIIANTEYNFDHAMRCGTHGFSERKAFAAGIVAFSDASADTDQTFAGTVTFATDCGTPNLINPNFDSLPYITFGFQESTAGGAAAWTPTNNIRGWSATITARSATAFSYLIAFDCNSTVNLAGWLHWYAVADVTAGE